ncbi:MAG: hypothetical protein IMW89_18410 [Ktedonobacteraceae bacterium]|nr:hypothetical protein [Ktedonobacteraceae bacterium]
MNSKQKKHSIWTIIILVLIFAFVFGTFAYAGSALLQTIDFAQFPQPATIIGSTLAGILFALILVLIRRKKDSE